MPTILGSCERKLLLHPLLLVGEGGVSSLGSSIYLVYLSLGVPFFVTVFKTVNYCHLDVQVSIKLCKNNWTCAWRSSDSTQSLGEETTPPELRFSTILVALSRQGYSSCPGLRTIPVTHPFTQFGSLLRDPYN